MTTKQKAIIGRLETIALPELAIADIQVRVDTGAKTSSLHVDNIVKLIWRPSSVYKHTVQYYF